MSLIIRRTVSYEWDTGKFYSRVNNSNVKVGDELTGTVKECGHVRISVNNKGILAHRLAYILMDKEVPEFIDHKDQDPTNNKWSNLRAATFQQNQWNTGKRTTNTSGYKNVSKVKNKERWTVSVTTPNGRKYIGSFKCPELANEAAITARKKYQGEFYHDK